MPTPRLSRAEIRKDTVQGAVTAVADTVGEVATIITSAVKDVVGSVGGLATELFELRDSARRAEADGRDLGSQESAPTDGGDWAQGPLD
ncbi:hypothetical protein [Nocardioides sp.]|uniref:hypothetical protein n=1 Tax=Nocardioides sp. TaxID=35761 RepID=UPI002620A20B|nr:hypothetical protein [Nocardioides sp.]